MRSYIELKELKTFQERFEYLKLKESVGSETFGFDRYLNQNFYTSKLWDSIRRKIIIRDNGCDLGLEGYDILAKGDILIHHINPITIDDVKNGSYSLTDLNNLICVSRSTHNAIHFGSDLHISVDPITRHPGDTCPWRNEHG